MKSVSVEEIRRRCEELGESFDQLTEGDILLIKKMVLAQSFIDDMTGGEANETPSN